MPRGDEDEIAARCDPLLFFIGFLVARAFLECFTLIPFLVANCGSLHASRTHFDSAARDREAGYRRRSTESETIYVEPPQERGIRPM